MLPFAYWGPGSNRMFPKGEKKEKVLVKCDACKHTKFVLPSEVPYPCSGCRSNMYPPRGWSVPKKEGPGGY